MSDMKKSATCHSKQSYYKYSKENETSTGEPSGKKNKILVKVDVHKDIEGTTQKIGVPSTKDDDPDILTIESDSNTGIQAHAESRKKILKGTGFQVFKNQVKVAISMFTILTLKLLLKTVLILWAHLSNIYWKIRS